MALPYDDPIIPDIDLGITKLAIGPTPGNELDYLRDYFKDLVPQDLGIPSGHEPESALPETYDENDPYAGIQDQTAMLGIPQGLKLSGMLKAYLKNRLKYAGASTATNMLLEAKAKAAEAAKAKAIATTKQYSGQGAQGGGGGTNIGGGQQTSKGIAGGAISHSAAKEARGDYEGWGLADGGLINFYRYGGFI